MAECTKTTDPVELVKKGTRGKSCPPRIVVVDDEPMLLELAALVIRGWRKDVVPMLFQRGEDAWQELLRADPDLLITDMCRGGLSGYEMLSLLAERNATFPILVTSGYAKEDDVRRCAGPNLKVTFIKKPYEAQQLQQYLSAHLGSGDDPQNSVQAAAVPTMLRPLPELS